ncbi:hypothetical protein I7I51_05234 [Histoplasma capsulatum]|uniref:Uncharacterized protein n=1 Tax=Ajellomyces capsulatus TaxID=5037 RepID=A0A8A1M486_AJECA|nr:hypothetical protein I7I51_05234 [Histoplasma capsulatum]
MEQDRGVTRQAVTRVDAKLEAHVPDVSLLLQLPRDDAPHQQDSRPTDMPLKISVHTKAGVILLDLSERSDQIRVLECLQRDGWVVLKNGASTESDEKALQNEVKELQTGYCFDVTERKAVCPCYPVRGTGWKQRLRDQLS